MAFWKSPRFSKSRARARLRVASFGYFCRAWSSVKTARSEPEGVERLGHVHLRAQVPRVAAEHLFAVFEHLEVVAAALGGLDPGLPPRRGEEREPAAAEVVAVLVLLGLAEGLAVEEVGRVEPAAGEQQRDGVVELPD